MNINKKIVFIMVLICLNIARIAADGVSCPQDPNSIKYNTLSPQQIIVYREECHLMPDVTTGGLMPFTPIFVDRKSVVATRTPGINSINSQYYE